MQSFYPTMNWEEVYVILSFSIPARENNWENKFDCCRYTYEINFTYHDTRIRVNWRQLNAMPIMKLCNHFTKYQKYKYVSILQQLFPFPIGWNNPRELFMGRNSYLRSCGNINITSP